ncbi:NAD(P)-binding protein [Clavulina sp. PMI_390]|nr:NAD(P)-binding protein [Clavulina sp. PMI_390]
MLSSTVIGSRILAAGGMFFGNLLPTLTVPPQDLSGKVAIVTGSNAGIGLECARQFARMGATVILACRDADKAERAREDILSSEKAQPDRVLVEPLDLGDADSVRSFLKRWGESGGRPIDILVNNAGRTTKTYQHARNTSKPYELVYYTNLLSHIQLTLGLLPFFATNARIVNVTSVAQYEVYEKPNVSDLSWFQRFEGTKEEGGWGMKLGDEMNSAQGTAIYYRTKFMQVVFTKELQKYLDGHPQYKGKNIAVYVCNPGLVKTQMYTSQEGAFGGVLPSKDQFFVKFVDTVAYSAEQGAATQTWLATSPDPLLTSAEGRGAYYDRQDKREPNGLVRGDFLTRQLWDTWVEAVKAEGVHNA